MNLHHEHHFEAEICTHLAANGWLHAEGNATREPAAPRQDARRRAAAGA